MLEKEFWKKKKLNNLSKEEWEALCDRCGKCCVIKLEDVDTSKIYYTKVSCKLLCTKTAKCKNYVNRKNFVKDCVVLSYNNIELLNWIKSISYDAEITSSVCTGSLLLAKAGLLDGKRATTHWGAIEALKSINKNIQVIDNRRIVNDEIITSAGVSSGIDMAFMIVENLFGEEVAKDTAKYVEFHRSKENV